MPGSPTKLSGRRAESPTKSSSSKRAESPTKTSGRRAESPTKGSAKRIESPTKSGTHLTVSNGAHKRAVSSPVKKSVSPFRRSPTKVDDNYTTAPEVREQARQVLEKFLQRSLSENNAGRGNVIRRIYRETSDLSEIKENRNSSNAEESSSQERRSSYVAAVFESSTMRNDERKHSTGSMGSQKSQKSLSMSVTKAEKIIIHERFKVKKPTPRMRSHEAQSPDSEFGDFSPNSTGQSRPEHVERETSDEEESVQEGRRKKSKFSQAKSRIRDSFLRKQRELSSSGGTRKSSKAQTPTETKTPSKVPKPSSSDQVPTITKKSPTPENGHTEVANGSSVLPRGSTDLEDESPRANYHNQAVHANSSPDGLNRINQQETKTKTSFWDWFRPTKRKTKQKERQKSRSRSLDVLTHPAYTVQNNTFTRMTSDQGNYKGVSGRHVHKKHSFSGRCSFSGKTNDGVDRSNLKLGGLRINKPRTPEPNNTKRVFPSDVVTDGDLAGDCIDGELAGDCVDVESPLDVPFHERTEAEKDEVYDLVASRLAEIANDYVEVTTSVEISSVRNVSADGGHVEKVTSEKVTSVEKGIGRILREVGDRHGQGDTNEEIEKMMVDAVKQAGYSKFEAHMKHQMNSEPNLQQLAWYFDVTKGAVQIAGVGGKLAVKVKDYSMRYFEEKFANWIIDRGGWDSMLSDEDGATGDDEGITF